MHIIQPFAATDAITGVGLIMSGASRTGLHALRLSLLQVRNKVMDAYDEVRQMRI